MGLNRPFVFGKIATWLKIRAEITRINVRIIA
jgi:hypothetical protein